MDEEMAALDANHTCELMSLPHDKKAIGCKWVHKVKHNAEGSVSRYKARLVACSMKVTKMMHIPIWIAGCEKPCMA